MNRYRLQVLVLFGAILLVAAGPGVSPNPLRLPAAGMRLYLPLTIGPGVCSSASGNSYAAGPVYQRDNDNPVRPAWNHADKNLALRGYQLNRSAYRGFVNYGTDDTRAPQLATLFSPNQVPAFTNAYEVFNWNWQPSPNPGTRGSLDTQWGGVTVLGLGAAPGEALHVPASGYQIGGGMSVIVLFADAGSITFKYTRDDSVEPNGYTLHVDNICTDPHLLALYHSLDAGPRYVYYGWPDNQVDYNLPNLPSGQVFGTARDTEIRVAIVDSGSFMDPRSCGDWWLIRPGRGCP
jgi:hypothetical protein